MVQQLNLPMATSFGIVTAFDIEKTALRVFIKASNFGTQEAYSTEKMGQRMNETLA
jgi:hypothetical protein